MPDASVAVDVPALRDEPRSSRASTVLVLAATVACATFLSGCVPAVVAAAAGGVALVASDRRTTTAQLDDESIELRLATSVSEKYGDTANASATAYNGIVLLTGQVPDAAAREDIERTARGIPGVRNVQNELEIGPNATLAERTRDTYTTSLVKSRLVENDHMRAIQVKVVTERDTVYLMGIVSRADGDAAGRIASTTANVARVVKVFEYAG